jgi:hypothetical protein
MIKKIIGGMIVAGALAVPLAGMAAADPTPSNPGVPGDIGGTPPGSVISNFAQQTPPGTIGHALGPIHGISTVAHEPG